MFGLFRNLSRDLDFEVARETRILDVEEDFKHIRGGVLSDPPRMMASSFDPYKDCLVEEFANRDEYRVKIPDGLTSMMDSGYGFAKKGDAYNFIDDLQ